MSMHLSIPQKKHITVQSEQWSSEISKRLSVRSAKDKFVLPVQKCGGDCTVKKLLWEMSVIFQHQYKMRER